MAHRQYKFSFYLNANHAIYINGKQGQHHPHTWQISLYVVKITEAFVMFHQVERAVEEFFSQYQDQDINQCDPFQDVNPTLENMSEIFFERIQEVLNKLGWMAFTMEVSETPARSYILTLGENENSGLDKQQDEQIERIIERAFYANLDEG